MNGRELILLLPAGTTKVRVAGKNQNDQDAQWDGFSNANGFALTQDWWWKGEVSIWYDYEGTTRYTKAYIAPDGPTRNVAVEYGGAVTDDIKSSEIPYLKGTGGGVRAIAGGTNTKGKGGAGNPSPIGATLSDPEAMENVGVALRNYLNNIRKYLEEHRLTPEQAQELGERQALGARQQQ